MSLLTRRLPQRVEVGGRYWPIDPDFRLMVELESAVTAPEGLTPEALGELLGQFFPQGAPPDGEGAVEGLLWFYRCGDREEKEGSGAPSRGRLYDFDQDGEALYTSFLQAFRIDLTTDRVHWWQFRKLMFGLPTDTPLPDMARKVLAQFHDAPPPFAWIIQNSTSEINSEKMANSSVPFYRYL